MRMNPEPGGKTVKHIKATSAAPSVISISHCLVSKEKPDAYVRCDVPVKVTEKFRFFR